MNVQDTMNSGKRLDEPVNTTAVRSSDPVIQDRFLAGWRLQLTTLSIALAMFIVNIEVSIVATALTSIVNGLSGSDQVGWVVTGYLTTYTSLIIVWSKFSNSFGRKTCLISALFIFTAFSSGCGAAQTMSQLIICRTFQGIGAAGCVSLGLTIAYEMVPQYKFPKYAAILSSVSAIGSLVGPILGGVFGEKASWRWVFLFNAPVGFVIILLLLFSIPNGFPQHLQWTTEAKGSDRLSSIVPKSLDILGLDILGAAFLLGASILLVTALLEGGVTFSWNSSTSLCLFIFSGLFWIAFFAQEYRIYVSRDTKCDPIFPWIFLKNRAWMGTLLLSMLSGVPYIVVIIDLPQRFQSIEGVSPLGAGLRLIPFNFLISVGTVMVNVLVAKTKIPPLALLTVGVVLQITGVSLIAFLSDIESVSRAIYGYQILVGSGIGFIFGLCIVLPPAVIDYEDFALCAGAVLQLRVLGGALGLAVASAVMNNYAKTHLKPILSPADLSLVMKSGSSLAHLPDSVRLSVLRVLVLSYNQRMKTLIGFTGAQFIGLAMLWRKPQIRILNAAQSDGEAVLEVQGDKRHEGKDPPS